MGADYVQVKHFLKEYSLYELGTYCIQQKSTLCQDTPPLVMLGSIILFK